MLRLTYCFTKMLLQIQIINCVYHQVGPDHSLVLTMNINGYEVSDREHTIYVGFFNIHRDVFIC